MSNANANAESTHVHPQTKFETISSAIVQTSDPQRPSQTIAAARNEVFRLGSIVGKLCSAFLAFPYDGDTQASKKYVNSEIATLLGDIFLQLFQLSRVCGIDLRSCVLKKMELNGRKYPVELCKVSCRAIDEKRS
jgi:dCTP diphosphatase